MIVCKYNPNYTEGGIFMRKNFKWASLFLVLVLICQLFSPISVSADILYGDMNQDGSVDSLDFAMLRAYLLSKLTATDDWGERADVYRDGEINSLDLAIFKSYLLGKTKDFPYYPYGQDPNEIEPSATPTASVTPESKEDWIPFIPQPENISLKLVIDRSNYREGRDQKAIQVSIIFNDGGYRIADEGKLMCSTTETGELYFYTSGVKIEKYVGDGGVTLALMRKDIEYLFDEQLGDKNHFDFKVYDTTVARFSFSQNSIISPEKVPYGETVNKNFVNANTQFAANLFEKFSKDDLDKNVFFSPYSISMALSMVYQGANATTKEAMAEALNYTGLTDEEINKSYKDQLSYFKKLYPQVELNVANSIWIRENFNVNESFISKNADIFNAKSTYLDFSKSDACDIMNKWIYDATKGKIDKMISPPIDPETIMYLMNAIYFKGDWAEHFDLMQTKDSYFTNIKGEKKLVPMMNKTDKYNYAQTNEYRAIELPYGAGNISMYCILPEQGNVNDFIDQFDSDKWNEIKSKLSIGSNIILSIPRFKIKYEPNEIVEKLSELGMGEAFSRNADLTGIGDEVWISDVKHKAVIDVNEKGTEAAAVTIIGAGTSTMPNSFIADKPFMFLIADNETGTILFMGKVVDLESINNSNVPTPTPTPVNESPTPSPSSNKVTYYYVNGIDVSNNPGVEIFVEKSSKEQIRVSAKTVYKAPPYADGWQKTYFKLGGSAVNGVDYEEINFDYFWREIGYGIDVNLGDNNPKREFSIIPIDTGTDETKDLEIYFGSSSEPAAIIHFVDSK